jgi:hypothetical protein
VVWHSSAAETEAEARRKTKRKAKDGFTDKVSHGNRLRANVLGRAQ